MNENLPAPTYYQNPHMTNPEGVAGTDPTFGGAAQVQSNLNFELMDLVQMGIVYAFIVAAALSAVFIFIGGVSFILSGGNEEKIKSAVNTIRYAIIGLIVTILSFTFVMIIGRMFGLNLMDYISYEQIRSSINNIVSNTAQEQTTPPPTSLISPSPTPVPAPTDDYIPAVIPPVNP